MEVAGAPIWSLEQVSERMEESTKRIVDNLQRNLEKIFDDVFSPIFSSMKLELKEMEEELEDEENQADLMEEEEVPETIFTGEELQSATISIGEEMSRCEQNFCSIISSFSGGVMVEKLGGGCRGGAGGSRGEFAGGFTGGGVPFASGVSSDFESSGLRNKAGGFVGGLYGGIFERGGAGCCGSGGGPGGCVENCSGGGMFGFRSKSSNQGPRLTVSGCRGNGRSGGSGSGNIEFTGGGGFTTGASGGQESSGQGVAGEKPSIGCNSLARNSLGGMFERGGAGGCGSGGGPGVCTGGADFLGGLAPWNSLQKLPVTMEYERSLESFVGLERKSKMIYASKGNFVNYQAHYIMAEESPWGSFSYHNVEWVPEKGKREEMSSSFTRPITKTFSSQPILSQPDYLSHSSHLIFQPIPISINPTHSNVFQPDPRTKLYFISQQLAQVKSTKTNSTQNSMISHYMLVHYSDFSATSDHCCQGRESSSDNKPP